MGWVCSAARTGWRLSGPDVLSQADSLWQLLPCLPAGVASCVEEQGDEEGYCQGKEGDCITAGHDDGRTAASKGMDEGADGLCDADASSTLR